LDQGRRQLDADAPPEGPEPRPGGREEALAVHARTALELHAESAALRKWTAQCELQDWDQIKFKAAALRAELVGSDEGRFIAAYRYLVSLKRKRSARVQGHVIEWQAAYGQVYRSAGVPNGPEDQGASDAVKERFGVMRLLLVESLNHKGLENTCVIGITDGRCDTWANLSSYITTTAQALGVGDYEESGVVVDDAGQQHRQGGGTSPRKPKGKHGGRSATRPSTPRRERHARKAKDACHQCGQRGNWKKDYPQAAGGPGSPGNGGSAGGQ
jgi:hypothetical protein